MILGLRESRVSTYFDIYLRHPALHRSHVLQRLILLLVVHNQLRRRAVLSTDRDRDRQVCREPNR